MEWIKKQIAWLVNQIICLFVSFLTGVRPKQSASFHFTPQRKVYFANHGSHGDFVLVWISLAHRWRRLARPVAGADYWLNNRFKRFIIQRVFNAVLIPRNSNNPQAIIAQLANVLAQGESIIIFPEGTRNTDPNITLLEFKSGIYHLAKTRPDTEFIPIWIDNINRVLPKGKILPVPLLCTVRMGEKITLQVDENKDDFLKRCRQVLLDLST